MSEQNEEYKIRSHKFIGQRSDGSATYEITLNKPLIHTGRFNGMEKGLNRYVELEKKAEAERKRIMNEQ